MACAITTIMGHFATR